jgi:hypothetical protein
MLKSYNFEIQVICPGCNTNHPVSSLLADGTCENCGKELILNNLIQQSFETGSFTGSFIDRIKIMNGFLTGVFNNHNSSAGLGAVSEFKMMCRSHPADCEECKTPLDESDILDSISNKKPVFCRKCNHPMPVRPADEKIKIFHPKAVAVINDSKGFDHNPKDVDSKSKTIVFSCMTCGAGLKLDNHSQRLSKCSFCDNENYLPDAVWNRLHPYKEPERIYLILDLDESDLKETLDYFFTTNIFTNYLLLGIRNTHFSDFIGAYFASENGVFLSDSVKSWWKILLNSKYERTSKDENINMEIELATGIFKILFIEDVKDIFFSNFRNAYGKLNTELKEFIAGNIIEIPDYIRDLLSKDSAESVRLALEKNKFSEKQITPALKKEKGFFGKLFG